MDQRVLANQWDPVSTRSDRSSHRWRLFPGRRLRRGDRACARQLYGWTGRNDSGGASHLVNYGSSGTAVTAVPNAGYQFVSWIEGLTTAARTDLNETSNLTVRPIFAMISNSEVPLPGLW